SSISKSIASPSAARPGLLAVDLPLEVVDVGFALLDAAGFLVGTGLFGLAVRPLRAGVASSSSSSSLVSSDASWAFLPRAVRWDDGAGLDAAPLALDVLAGPALDLAALLVVFICGASSSSDSLPCSSSSAASS